MRTDTPFSKGILLPNLMLLMALTAFMPGCNKTKEVEDVRPVRTVLVEKKQNEVPVLITGKIEAHTTVSASFRTSGKVVERMVSIGSPIKMGQPIALLDSKIEKDSLAAAKSDLAAAQAVVEQAQSAEKRANSLVREHAISQSEYDDALRQFKGAQAQVAGAEAKLHAAQEQMGFTLLNSETNGVVIEKGAEVGEVVSAGQMIVRIAENKVIDAVFDMPEMLIRQGVSKGEKIEIRLNAEKNIRAEGAIYEIAPQADSVTRTYLVKVAIENFPPQMLLGATVVGSLKLSVPPSIQIPASALTELNGQPAVWRVDATEKTVQLAPVKIERYTTESAVIADGLQSGDIVVTAGVQALHQNQKVKLLDVSHE